MKQCTHRHTYSRFFLPLSRTHTHTHNTKMNKSTKVWLNRRSKHNWKLKYKRWQNNCFVADDHIGIVTTPLPHCNCHWRSVKHWSRQTTQPKPLNADVKKSVHTDFYDWLHFDCDIESNEHFTNCTQKPMVDHLLLDRIKSIQSIFCTTIIIIIIASNDTIWNPTNRCT